MLAAKAIELARAYVEASNAHDLAKVEAMLTQDARYLSSVVGTYRGRGAIRAMMERFFAAYPDVYWRTKTYRPAGKTGAAFDFVMTASAKEGGEEIERRGIERIFFAPDGLITLIEVAAD